MGSVAHPGVPFHGEFSSANASALSEANSRITLYGAGSTTALTLASTDRVLITDLNVETLGTLTVQVYDGADATVDAGERIYQGDLLTTSAANTNASTPYTCQAGRYPKVKTSGAGQVDVQIRGYIIGR